MPLTIFVNCTYPLIHCSKISDVKTLLLRVAKKTGDYPAINKRNDNYSKHVILMAKEKMFFGIGL